jgi:ABC-type polysaccharide/polyol phosphate transport system ATPase subunit
VSARLPAIAFDSVSKTFAIPHEQRTTFKELFLHPRRRTTYELNHALQTVSFEVAEGEMFGVIGPNGSGKSTLLKLIAGIYPPDSGTITVDGLLSPFIELGVGFNPELNARDNIEVNGTLLGLSRQELEARFDDILEFSELERFVDQKLKNFSSGMLARLAYSIAIQVPFDILLLDEVLAVGDQSFQEKCYETFREMRRAGKTVVFVSHDLDTVVRWCDRVLLLRMGGPEALGPSAEVVARYAEEAANDDLARALRAEPIQR